jgi:four helix bundle protein
MKGYQCIRGSGHQGKKIARYPEKELMKFFVKERNETEFVAGFERLWVWQKAFKLMKVIHRFCMKLPHEEKFLLKSQIIRSSSSVCDNISEGYSSYYYNDKIKGFNVARKEAGETQNHIRKMIGKNYIDTENGTKWLEEYEEVIRGINGFIKYIRTKKAKK